MITVYIKMQNIFKCSKNSIIYSSEKTRIWFILVHIVLF